MRNNSSSVSRLRTVQRAAFHARNAVAPRSGLKWQTLNRDVRILHVSEPTARNLPDADFVFSTGWQTAEYVVEYPKEKGERFNIVMDFAPWIASQDVLDRTWRWPLKKITISQWLFDQVRQSGCPAADIVNIPIGINFDHFRLSNAISKRPRRISMLYSSAPSKGSEDGLAALKLCKLEHPDLEIILFGSSMRFRPANLPAWARYEGNVSQRRLTEILNSSSIYVCSSLAEGFALPPAEAMACGCAVASTDCGGNREYARHDLNALVSPAGDSAGLAVNINRLLSNDALRVDIAESGHQTIQDFTWERSTDRLEGLLTAN